MDWQEEVRRVHQLGLDARAKLPFENAGIPFRLRPYKSPAVRGQDLILEDGLDDKFRSLLRTVFVSMFRAIKLPAALIQSDARQLKMQEVCQLFGLPAGLGYDETQIEYFRILNEQFGGTMENLPRHLWTDSIFTTIKGPEVMPWMLSTCYHGDQDGKVVYEETIETPGVESYILPDWWESTLN